MDTLLATNTVRVVRMFDAPRERVFTAWIDPRQFAAWMCPPGFGLDRCELDARTGGAWCAQGYKPDGSHFAKSGTYLEVKRPERLVFTWAHHADDTFASARGQETTVRVEFRAVGSRTELTLTQGPFTDAPNFNGHNEGWKGSFDKLADFLAKAA
jgi:uncharacterized protein YndB with AHSA1/START domain